MSLRFPPAPLSPTDASPLAVNLATNARVEVSQCVAPHARAVHSNGTTLTHALDHSTLPLCAGVLTDAQGRESLPFAVAVSADSYRQSLLQAAKDRHLAEKAARDAANPSLAHVSSDGRSVIASAEAPLLTLADLSRLTDSLLCNSSLTSLDFARALPANSLPLLNILLQQHPSLVHINLAGNALGAGGKDSEELRMVCNTLASPLSLPHLATLDLAHK